MPRGKKSGKAALKGVVRAALDPSLPDPPVFIEIFSKKHGSTQRLERAPPGHQSWKRLRPDSEVQPAQDPGVDAQRPNTGGHLGTPCASFSRARDNPPGPPPLRSNQFPLGLAGLSKKDTFKVKVGNILMRFSVRVMNLRILLGVPMSLENHRTSRLWICPGALQLLRRPQVSVHVTDFCQFGMPWRKSTQFAGALVNLEPLSHHRCRGSRGTCSRTGERHVVLAGTNDQGVFWTQVAEPYPHRLCRLIAQCFESFEVEQLAEQVRKRLNQGAS